MDSKNLRESYRKKVIYDNLSAKLKKLIDERDPENILETLEKCANIIKFSHHKIKQAEDEEN